MSDQHHRLPPRHPVNLLAAGISDAARSGSRVLESAAGGLAESLHVRASYSGPRRTPGHRTAQYAAAAEDLLQIFAELLNRTGEVAQAVAKAIADQRGNAGDDDQGLTAARVEIEASADEVATGEFTIWNTGSSALRDVRFAATDLIGSAGRISADQVSFHPSGIDRIVPGEGVTVSVSVKPSFARTPAVYHGAVTGEPGAGAVLLTVRSTPA